MATFNGIAYFIDKQPIPALMFSTDACNSGGAGFYGGDRFYVHWEADEPHICDSHINEKELYTILLAARRWGPLWTNKRVTVYTDSDSSACALNKGTSPSPSFMQHIRELFWISATNNFLMTARHVKGTENTLADALSRLTDPTCATRAETDLEQWSRQNSDVMQIKCDHPPVSANALSVLPPQATSWIARLLWTRTPGPGYAVFLARTLKFSSIVGYLNIIRILHHEAGYENPLQDNWLLQTTLRGIRRYHGDSVQQKLPITPSILRAIHNKLDFSRAYHVVFWAACVVAFFSFFRAVITVRWSKTIQFKERTVLIPIPRITDCPLCPTTAVEKAFYLTDTAEPDGPTFVLPQETGPGFTPLTHKPLVTTLRTLLRQCGYPDSAYSGHSFRRVRMRTPT
ncbi:hypothetical protein Bbelb_253450 [Branchiostoma belcheri]|nr:hypothetical protein Bbelb_253450 [Branchiostoma belcheri]